MNLRYHVLKMAWKQLNEGRTLNFLLGARHFNFTISNSVRYCRSTSCFWMCQLFNEVQSNKGQSSYIAFTCILYLSDLLVVKPKCRCNNCCQEVFPKSLFFLNET